MLAVAFLPRWLSIHGSRFILIGINIHLNPTEQTCNTVGFRQFIVAYNTYLHKMVILTKYNLVENLGPNPKKWELKLRTSRRCRIVREDGFA